jgi:hypothetical protein
MTNISEGGNKTSSNNNSNSNNNNNNNNNNNSNNSNNSIISNNNNNNSTSNNISDISSVAAAAAAAFGSTMAQSEMMNFGVSAATMMAANAAAATIASSNISNNHSSSSGKKKKKSSSFKKPKEFEYKNVSIHQAKDALQKYVDGVTTATTAPPSSASASKNATANTTAASSTRKGKHKKDSNNSSNKNKAFSSSSSSNHNSTGGNVGPGITSQSCSDEDMKNLMSMFVEIMGMQSNLDGSNNSSSSSSSNNHSDNHHQNNKSGNNNSNNNNNNNNSNHHNMDATAMNIARASLNEHMNRINNMQNNNGNSRKSSGDNNKNNNSKSSSSSSNSPFPVVSMMFGNGSSNNNSNKEFPHVLPPPPGGWPPGAAAAAAAALAAASNGASSVTLPIGGGSISLPLGMVAHHNTFTSHIGGDNIGGSGPPDWMRDACKFINEDNDYDDGSDMASDSDNECDIDDDKIHATKAAPQDRKSGESLIDQKNAPFENAIDLSNAAAAELLREEEEAALKLQEEEEKMKRAAKKREKKNRKKEKSRREAAIKAAQAAQKKREKSINSWRSRVASACLGGEVNKIDALISDNPFKETKQHNIDPEILDEMGGNHLSFEEEINENMLWLLPSCVAKSRNLKGKEKESRTKLGIFVIRMAFHVVFIPRQHCRTAFHTACLVGDISFVKLVTEKIRGEENDQQQIHLNILCEDLGWSPLHYAAVGGWSDIVENLLSTGCDVDIETDPNLTSILRYVLYIKLHDNIFLSKCVDEFLSLNELCSNDNGISTKELLKLIRDDTYANMLDFNSDTLQDFMDDKSKRTTSDQAMYREDVEKLIERFNFVEKNGYSPLENEEVESGNVNDDNNYQDNNRTVKSKNEDNKNSKKKKKKKKKGQSSNDDVEESSSVSMSVSVMPKREAEVDLVSMLLAMGFEEQQIHAAADACGGTDNATADDLIEWILGGGATDNSSPNNGNSVSNSGATTETVNLGSNSLEASSVDHKQLIAATLAEKEAAEAAKREAEAKAAAERLAAKRAEQKKIRMEWNNREHLRQQEEVKARLIEEVERKRRLEIEKANAVAQRVAKERVFGNTALMFQETNATIPSTIRSVNALPVGNNASVGSVSLFPGTSFQVSNNAQLPPNSPYYPDMQAPNLAYGHSVIQTQASRPFPQAAPSLRSTPTATVDASAGTTLNPSSRSKPSPINLEMSGYEFPSLGSNTPPSSSMKNKAKKEVANTSGENRKAGKSKARKKKNDMPSKSLRPSAVNTILQNNVSLDQVDVVEAESYESNPLGEIRATAKAFVPTHFTPSSAKTPPPGLKNSPKSVPPGLVPSPAANPLLSANLTQKLSIASTATASILQGGSSTGSSMHSVEYNITPFDVNNSSTKSITQKFDKPTHSISASPVPPAQSDNSPDVDVSVPDDSMSLGFGAAGNNDGLLNPNPLGGLSTASIVGSSLGMLEPSTTAPSLAGSSIWGDAPVTTAPTMPTNSNLGGFPFNFSDSTNNSGNVNLTNNEKKNDDSLNDPSSLWGTGGMSSLNGGGGGGGSIW